MPIRCVRDWELLMELFCHGLHGWTRILIKKNQVHPV